MSQTRTATIDGTEVHPDRVVTAITFGRLAATTTNLASNDRCRVIDHRADGQDALAFWAPTAHPVGTETIDPGATVDRLDPDTSAVIVAAPLADAGGEPLAILEALDDHGKPAIAVVSLPNPGEPAHEHPGSLLDRIRSVAEMTVVIPGRDRSEQLRSVVAAFSSIVTESGLINLDLADVRSIVPPGSVAAVTSGLGTPGRGEVPPAVMATEEAIGRLPDEPIEADGVLLQLVVGAQTAVAETIAAVERLRPVLSDDDPLIWGVTVDPYHSGVTAHVVVGFDERPWLDDALDRVGTLRSGGSCPRCGGHVATYRLGNRERLACDRCGYTDVGLRLS